MRVAEEQGVLHFREEDIVWPGDDVEMSGMSELWVAGEHDQVGGVGKDGEEDFQDRDLPQLPKALVAEVAQVVTHCCLSSIII